MLIGGVSSVTVLVSGGTVAAAFLAYCFWGVVGASMIALAVHGRAGAAFLLWELRGNAA